MQQEDFFDEEIQRAKNALVYGFKKVVFKAFATSGYQIDDVEVSVSLGLITVKITIRTKDNDVETITISNPSAKQVREKIIGMATRFSKNCPNGEICPLDSSPNMVHSEKIVRA